MTRWNMWRLLRTLLYLLVLAGIGLVGYAYVGPFLGADFSPSQREIVEPVELDLGS